MLIRALIIFMLVTNCYAVVSSYQREVDYDKMLRENSKVKHYTSAEIEEMQKVRRERRNAEIEYKMQQLERPKSVSRLSSGREGSRGQKVGESVSKEGYKIIIAIIVLFIGVFMLLYSNSSFSRKNEKNRN